MAAAAPTRMCCRYPSWSNASGSPSVIAYSRTIPEYVPGRMQYFSCVRPPGHETTSDFSRTATTP